MTDTRLLLLFVILTPIVVGLIRLALKKAQIAVLRNLSALLLTGFVVLMFAALAASFAKYPAGSSPNRGFVETAINFCLIFTPAHWIFKIVQNWREKRRQG